MSVANIIFFTPPHFYETMTHTIVHLHKVKNIKVDTRANSPTLFGSVSTIGLIVKVVRGGDFNNRFAH